jgi:hypothetical protein
MGLLESGVASDSSAARISTIVITFTFFNTKENTVNSVFWPGIYCMRLSGTSYQLSAISYQQLSAISYQVSAISYQVSAIRYHVLSFLRMWKSDSELCELTAVS